MRYQLPRATNTYSGRTEPFGDNFENDWRTGNGLLFQPRSARRGKMVKVKTIGKYCVATIPKRMSVMILWRKRSALQLGLHSDSGPHNLSRAKGPARASTRWKRWYSLKVGLSPSDSAI